MRRIKRRDLVASAIAPALAACSGHRQPRDRSTVTVLHRGGLEALSDPVYMPGKFLVFMPLAAWNSRGELEGRLAEAWEHSPDFRTWIIRLRDGIRWHDGVPVTAHDVKFTLDLLQHPDTLQFAPGGYTVNVLDDRTYTITYHRQDPDDDGAVNDWTVCWPKHLLKSLDPKQINTWDFWSHPVGCGPYRHVRTVPKSMMEFVANQDYFRGKPQIQNVVLKLGGTSAIPELLSRNVDAVSSPSRADVSNISRDRRFRAHQQILAWSFYALYWNIRHPLFQDALVRRALTCAINRRELTQVLNLPEDSYPIDFIGMGRQFRHSDFSEPNPYSPALAGRLLDQAGWLRHGKSLRERNGRKFRFQALALGTAAEIAPAVYVQDQLKRVGVHMAIITISDHGLVNSRVKRGEFEVALAMLGPWNREALLGTGYDGASFFGLLDKTRVTFDPEEKQRLQRELIRIAHEDLPLTLLFPYVGTSIASARLRGLDNSPYREDPAWCMDQLWLEEEG
jgi:peptide/nickel transport system substrate-binding protein